MNAPKLLVLIVDDDPLCSHTISAILCSLGCITVVAATMKQAIDALKTTGTDLVLLDLMLPDSHAQETISRITELKIMTGARVVVITGSDVTQDLIDRCVEEGAENVLGKGDPNFHRMLRVLVG